MELTYHFLVVVFALFFLVANISTEKGISGTISKIILKLGALFCVIYGGAMLFKTVGIIP